MNAREIVQQYCEKGQLESYAWPGGYPIMYFDCDGSELCADCATADVAADMSAALEFHTPSTIVAADIYYEGPIIYCAGCNCEIESAYGDPDEADADTE